MQSKGHIDYNIRKVYNMLLTLKMEPKEAKKVLAHALNLHTEQGKADLNYMLKDVYDAFDMEGEPNRHGKNTQFYQAWHTAKRDGLSMRSIIKELNISRNKYYADLESPNTLLWGSKEYHQLHSHDLNLSPIERVLRLAKEYPIL